MALKGIIWTKTAAKQRNSILRYWVKHNQSNVYSLKLLRASNEKAKLIAKNPALYRKSEYPNTRVAFMGNFSIYYQIQQIQL